MRINFLSLLSGLALLATVLVPPMMYAMLGTSSMATGILLIAVLFSFLLLMLNPINWFRQISTNIAFVIFASMTVIFILGEYSWLTNEEFDFDRFWQSELFLTIFIFGASSLALLVQKTPNRHAHFAVNFVFFILFISGLAGIFKYSLFVGDNFTKPVLFFAEPSHFALSFLPFLLYIVVLSTLRMKLFFIFVGFVMAILLENLTLVIGISLVAFLTVPFRWMLFVVPIAAIVLSRLDISYYMARVDILNDSQNLSALVYMQGWERAYLSFKDSFGIGVGFQQFGVVGSLGEIMEKIVNLVGEEINLLDGGSLAPKIIGEFGIFGVLALSTYLVYFVKRVKWLHAVSLSGVRPNDYKQVFFLACFVMFSIDIFIRGTGYFSSSGFLFIASLVWMGLKTSTGSSQIVSEFERTAQ